MNLALDTNILGMVCHPRKHAEARLWFRGAQAVRGHRIFLPALADFELRRELLRLNASASLRELDRLRAELAVIPVSDEVLADAAALWASLWGRGLPLGTADALAADVIIAAQARAVGATVVTTNLAHLGRMVPVARWEDL